MKQILFLMLPLLISSCGKRTSQEADIQEIKGILESQQSAWSENDIETFMNGYWRSDALTFYGSSGITKGWEATLANYKKRYPTKSETGILKFTLDDISQINEDAYWVMGQYHLTRTIGDAHGTFMIIFKRIDGKWKIIGDSSC